MSGSERVDGGRATKGADPALSPQMSAGCLSPGSHGPGCRFYIHAWGAAATGGANSKTCASRTVHVILAQVIFEAFGLSAAERQLFLHVASHADGLKLHDLVQICADGLLTRSYKRLEAEVPPEA